MITITFDPRNVITWLIIGLFAGFLASILIRGRGMSVTSSIVVGLIGALVGGIIFSLLKLAISPELNEGITLRFIDIIVSFIGAVIVLLLFGRVWSRRL